MLLSFFIAFILIIFFILVGGAGAYYFSKGELPDSLATAASTVTTTVSTATTASTAASSQNIATKNCVPVDKCSPNGQCDENGGCNCDHGWDGPTCKKRQFKCTEADCSNNGKPIPEWLPKGTPTKDCTCQCNAGYTGKDCSIPNCSNCVVDLSKSKCYANKTCIKNNNKWLCIRGHYLDIGNGTPETMDCLQCPEGSKLLDSIYTGENTLEQCKCMDQVNDENGNVQDIQANAYLDVKEKKCVKCSESDWSIMDGRSGKSITAPKDDDLNPIKDWIVYDNEKQNPSGNSSDCKCNTSKHFHKSNIQANKCIKCYPGANLEKKNNLVELCKCQSPDWRMEFAPPPNNPGGENVPICVQNNLCVNPTFSDGGNNISPSQDYCANKNYFSYGDSEDREGWGDFMQRDKPSINMELAQNYKDFSEPGTGQVKCRLLETPDMIKMREKLEAEQEKKMGDKNREYLETAEKVQAINSMIENAKKHIQQEEYGNAEIILKDASMYAKGYENLEESEKSTWKPYKFNSTGRIEVKDIPETGAWNQIKAIELKENITGGPGRIIFSDNDIKEGNLVEGAMIRLNTKCGTNIYPSDIKIHKIRKIPSLPRMGVVPMIGYDFKGVKEDNIKGDDCSFERILNPLTETQPIGELMDENDKVTDLLNELKNLKAQALEQKKKQKKERKIE